MRKILVCIALPIVAAGAASGTAYWWHEARFIERTDNAYVEGDISHISARIEGYVFGVYASDNQAVEAGDVLATLDDFDYRARVVEANAALFAAKAAVTTIDRQVEHQQALIAQMQASLSSAKAELTRATATHDRYKQLVKEKIVGTQDLESAVAQYMVAQAEVSRLAAALSAESRQLDVLGSTRLEAAAHVDEAAARLRLAESDLEKTVIRAPIAGVIGNRELRVGQYVKPGTSLLSVVPTNVHVVANFKETQLEFIRPGQPVMISVDAFPSEAILGHVESFAPASGSQFSLLPPENATGNFTKIVQRVPVRVAIEPSDQLRGLLRPGLSVEAAVDTRSTRPSEEIVAKGDWLLGSAIAHASQ